MRRRTQRGTTTVEFAIIGAVVITLLFAVIEFGRILFSLSVLQEGARRATRVAAVCAVNNDAIENAAVFVELPGLTTDNVVIAYLDQNGAVLADPAGANYSAIRYVRVSIVNYAFAIVIPLVPKTFNVPEFSSTLPRESLGVPRFGEAAAC